LEDLISEGFERTRTILLEKGRELSESNIQDIAVGAIKYSYLMQDRERNIVFDWDKALSFE
jgi:arginyl-tRNA synthetase